MTPLNMQIAEGNVSFNYLNKLPPLDHVMAWPLSQFGGFLTLKCVFRGVGSSSGHICKTLGIKVMARLGWCYWLDAFFTPADT